MCFSFGQFYAFQEGVGEDLFNRHSLFWVFLNQASDEGFYVLAEVLGVGDVYLGLGGQLRLGSFFLFISCSCGRMGLFRSLAKTQGLQCTRDRRFSHIPILEEFQGPHSRKFRNRSFFFVSHKKQPIQSPQVYIHPELNIKITLVIIIF